jgi:PAS domain S-box-containing protein
MTALESLWTTLPAAEQQRLEALYALELLDTPPEERFDRISRIAQRLFDVPIVTLTLVDMQRQWFKSRIGVEDTETPRDIAFCAYTILDDATLVVEDALQDTRFAHNPLVQGEPNIRFYAGHPLAARDGSRVGTLCLIDRQPRSREQVDLSLFRELAAIAENELNRQVRENRMLFGLADQQKLLELTPEAVLTLVDGRVSWANAAAFEMLGATDTDQLLGRPFIDFVAPDAREPVTWRLQRASEGHPSAGLLQERWLRCDGTELDVETVLGPATQRGGGQIFARDVRERNRLQQQLLQSQKMEAIGRLAGGIAHDFNNLLTVINGYADLLLNTVDSGDPSHEALRDIAQAGQRASELTRQLLAFSRKQMVQPRLLDLNVVVKDFTNMLQRLLHRLVTVDLKLADDLPHIYADRTQLEQVLLNLAVNARDAMPTGGWLFIETALTELDADWVAAHPDAQEGPHVRLTVRDTGPGMDAATAQQIFEPFFTTKPAGQGTGLGLATVYGIVHRSDGHIVLETAPGRGASFSLFFPCTQQHCAGAS